MSALVVLVTDGHLRPSLAVVRSLGRAGHRVYVTSTHRRSLAGASKYAIAEEQIPSPLTSPNGFVEAITRLIERWNVNVLMPMSEEALLALLPARATLGDVRIPFAPLETFRKASDKGHVTALASSLGIAVPEQVVAEQRSDMETLNFDALGSPLVLKPSRSVGNDGSERVKQNVTYARDRNEALTAVAAMSESAFPLLVQRRIEGAGTGVFLLMWNGRLLAQFAHRRLREKPPSGGVSVLSESIALDPSVADQSKRLLAALSWCGPAMVEFKQDRTTGRHYLMEINGRFWGSLQLSIDAGVDFPALLVSAATGDQPRAVTSYQLGVRTRWWWGEVDHLIARLRGGLDVPGLGGRATAVWQFLRPGTGIHNEVLHADDPRPFVRETIDWIRGI